MAWVYLIIAGIFEWGWPVGLKLGLAESGLRWGWIGFSVLCMAVSGKLLLIAQKTIPMGTAYAVWTGIGAVGTFALACWCSASRRRWRGSFLSASSSSGSSA